MAGNSGGGGGLESSIIAHFLIIAHRRRCYISVCYGIVSYIVVVGGIACFLGVDDMVECVTA